MLVVDGDQRSTVCHLAWHRDTGWGGMMARGQDLAHSCMGGSPLGCLSLTRRAQIICPPFKMPWAVQQEVVGRSLFEGLSGHFWEVTEITVGIRAVPIHVSHIHMDGNRHGQPQPMLLAKEEPTADSRAGLWCGCWYFRCGFKWPRVKLR